MHSIPPDPSPPLSLTSEPQSGQAQAAVEKLLALEKQTRQASDLASTSRVIVAIVTICKNAGDWSLLNEQVLVLSKKHGQLKQAITKMVQVVMACLDEAPSKEVKLAVIETLRTVTEGKVCGRSTWAARSLARWDDKLTSWYRYSSRWSEHGSRGYYRT